MRVLLRERSLLLLAGRPKGAAAIKLAGPVKTKRSTVFCQINGQVGADYVAMPRHSEQWSIPWHVQLLCLHESVAHSNNSNKKVLNNPFPCFITAPPGSPPFAC